MTKHQEKGSALLIVLGLVAVIAGWASSAAYEDMLALRRAENALSAQKAELACLSALELVKQGLLEDAKTSQTDNLDEQWAQQAPPFPVDDGLVSGSVVDANRYLNINDLVNAQGAADLPMVHTMQRLFTSMKLDPSLVDALVDWLDKDDQPFGYAGAEDSSYFARPYKIKNATLDRLSELRLIQGFSADMLPQLQQHLIALPKLTPVSHININTVSISVMLAMFPNMTTADAEQILQNRPYDTTQLSTLKTAPWATGGEAAGMFSHLSVSSDVFIVQTHAIFERADRREEVALQRQGNKLTWLWRERILWQPPQPPTQQAGLP